LPVTAFTFPAASRRYAEHLLNQFQAVTRAALVTEPRPAPLFIVKAKAVRAAAHRAGLMAVFITFTPSAGRMRGQWPHACFTVSVTFIFIVIFSLSAVQAM
jgi:hypothetical protein